ncbi:MAG: hypothetical protein H6858_04780 [Rhodospirillales bacterium]|nr:hypothetical protein [Alphaproteobacteria bacterium]MCB9976899.1 hypothetical protein [Rhodospirillales bacterium]
MTNKLPDPIRPGRAGGVISSPINKLEEKKREPCDFEHWGKMATWTLPQAHGLCFGIALVQAGIYEHNKLIKLMAHSKQPYQQEMFKVWSLIKNAYDSIILPDRVKPIFFIQWADTHGVAIPKELRASVEETEHKRRETLDEAKDSTQKPLHTTERETLLKIIAGLAIAAYRYDPKKGKNEAIIEIKQDLRKLGVSMSDDTIRKKIQEGIELIPQSQDA